MFGKIHPMSNEGRFLTWLKCQEPGQIFCANDTAKAINSTPTNIGHFCRLYDRNVQAYGRTANGITRRYQVITTEILQP